MSVKNKRKSENNNISKMKYFYSSYNEHPEEILSSLKGKSDPESIRQKLTVLLNSKDYEKAAKLVIRKKPNQVWYDLAIVALTNCGYTDKVKEFLCWSSNQETIIWHRAIYLYAINQFKRTWRNRKNDEEIRIGSLDETETKELEQLIYTIQPVLKFIEGTGNATSKSQEDVLNVALKSYVLLEDKQNTSKYSSYSKDSLTLANLVLCGHIKLPGNLIENLESNYPDSYQAQKLAILLKSQCEILNEEDFDKAINKLAKYLSTKDQKVEIFQIISDIAHKLGEPSLKIFEQKVTQLLGEDERIVRLFKCERLLNQKAIPEAKRILSETKDENDAVWLQLYGQYLYLDGKMSDALEYIDKARLLLPHPELINSAARLAFETKNYDLSIELLEQERKKEPDNISHLNNIAAACFRKGDYKSAATYFEKLKALKSEELSHFLNLATCYVQIGDSNKALDIYNEICKCEDAPLDAFLYRAYLMRISNPAKAFDSILPIKDKYWENSQYLQVVLDLSFKAGKEEYGHQAMLKLLELQREGKAPQEILQGKTIEDLKVHMEDWNKRVEIINRNILSGKFLWLMADHWQNHTAYMGWYIRTQPFSWRIEEPLTCASFSIYSTNSFSVVKLSNDTDITKLDFIECPAKDTEITVDLSALITLHRLGLLEKCIRYFSNIYISQEYPAKLLRDSDRLVIPQLTRKTSAELIIKAVNAGQIIIEDVEKSGDETFPFIHEHTLPEKEDRHYYRLIDLIQVAYDMGKLNEEKYKSLKKIAHKQSGIDQEHPELKHGRSVLVDVHTLYSVCQIDAESLEPILNTFRVHISKKDQLRNSGEIIQIETQEQISLWNDQLLQIIRDKDEFIKIPHKADPRLEEDSLYLASWQIAKEKSLPLLVDDRVLQVLSINESKTVDYPSFGTDRLLLKLFEDKLINIEELSDAFLKLMNWRYRFVVPTKHILIALAKRYKKHPPGKDLQDVALYIHDCMRDLGLFTGHENTTLKETMAARLYATWTRTTTEFLAGIWADSQFSEEAAKKITEWALKEFSPSLPKNTSANNRHISEALPKATFDYFLALTFNIDDTSRANKALQIIASGLNMSEIEYFKAVSEVVDKYGI